MITPQPVKLSSAEIWTVPSANEREAKGLEGTVVERMVAKGKRDVEITNRKRRKKVR
jgi:hypothetical protein